MQFKKIEIKPVGFVKRSSPTENVKDKNLVSKIVLKKNLTEALEGIEDFSHLFVVFWLHKAFATEKLVPKVHPWGKTELPVVGVFATRTPNRPNPLGMTLVELVKRERNILWVKGLDAFDGTPVVDIKPYDKLDSVDCFQVPEWHAKKHRWPA